MRICISNKLSGDVNAATGLGTTLRKARILVRKLRGEGLIILTVKSPLNFNYTYQLYLLSAEFVGTYHRLLCINILFFQLDC